MQILTATGLFWGMLLFIFTYTLTKKSGKHFSPLIVNVLAAFLITAYSVFVVGGFEGMAYGVLGLGFLITGIIGTIAIRFFALKGESKDLGRRDRVTLATIPILFISSFILLIYSQDHHWVIDKGSKKYIEAAEHEYEDYYRVNTISEGKKQVTLTLGKDFLGKDIDVKKVSQSGKTEIILEVSEGENNGYVPYIMIGVDEVKEPLIVRTEDGVVFESFGEKVMRE
jgi:YesK-like protein